MPPMATSRRADMFLDPADDPRETGPPVTDERSALTAFLRSVRLTLEIKCQGLDAEQMARRSVEPSTMSLLGLVRHLAEMERHTFRTVMAGEDAPRLYTSKTDRDADFDGAVGDQKVVDQAWDAWREEVRNAERFVADAPSLDLTAEHRDGLGAGDTPISLREAMLEMLHEYARHLGHADLLRERIDGRIGQ